MLWIVLLIFTQATSSTSFNSDSITSTLEAHSSDGLKASTYSQSFSKGSVGSYILQGLGANSTAQDEPGLSSVDVASESAPPANPFQNSSSAFNGPYSVPTSLPPIVSQPFVFYPSVFTISDSESSRSQAEKCWSEIIAWTTSSVSWHNAYIAGRTWPLSYSTSIDKQKTSWRNTSYPSSVSTYKLCDGSPRADVRPYTTSSTFWYTWETITFTSPATPTFTPRPCTPSPEECHIWFNQSNIPQVYTDEFDDLCGNPAHGQNSCWFGISGAVELIYFPVKAGGSNDSLCAKNASGITTTAAEGEVTVITTLGHTFTTGSVYLSINSLWAFMDDFQYTIGPTLSNYILTLASSDVSSECMGDGTATSLNWADLNWPVPASAYNCQARCDLSNGTLPSPCSTIWSDVNPLLAIPTKVKELFPSWSTCDLHNAYLADFWFDPPIALTPVAVAAQMTLPATVQTVPAAPVSIAKSPAAPSTSAAAVDRPLPTSIASGNDLPAQFDSSSSMPSSPEETDSPTVLVSIAETSDPGPSFSASDPSIPALFVPTPAFSSLRSQVSSEQVSISLEVGLSTAQNTATINDPTRGSGEASQIFSFDPIASASTAPSEQSALPIIVPGGQSIPASSPPIRPEAFVSGALTLSQGGSAVTLVENTMAQVSNGPTSPATADIFMLTALSPQLGQSTANSLTLAVSYVPGQSDVLAVDGDTLYPGGPPATVSGIELSNAATEVIATAVGIVGNSSGTQSSQPHSEDPMPSVMTAQGVTVTASAMPASKGILVDGNVLSEGGSAMASDSATITYGSNGLALLVSQKSASFEVIKPTATGEMVYVLGDLRITASEVAGPTVAYVVDGTTLSLDGSAATISSMTVTAGPGGLEVMKSNTTQRMSTTPLTETLPPIVSDTSVGSSTPTTKPTAKPSHSAADAALFQSKWLAISAFLAALHGVLSPASQHLMI